MFRRTLPLLLAFAATDPVADARADAPESGWRTHVTAAPAAAPPPAPTATGAKVRRGPKSHALDGIASYYWQDQMTASGEVFDKRAMTAAHPTLPFGTLVEVTNLGNGRRTVVRINDRGPFKPGRIIDVSEAAAEVLDMQSRGLAPVRLEIVSAANDR